VRSDRLCLRLGFACATAAAECGAFGRVVRMVVEVVSAQPGTGGPCTSFAPQLTAASSFEPDLHRTIPPPTAAGGRTTPPLQAHIVRAQCLPQRAPLRAGPREHRAGAARAADARRVRAGAQQLLC
jgi:hypothetical protein